MLTGSIALTAAVALIVGALMAKRRARRQSTWTQVQAQVVHSAAELGRVIMPTIHYDYVIDGRRYRGIRLCSLEIGSAWPGSARRTVEKYPVGSRVTAFVEPGHPENAVLVPGGDRWFLPFAFLVAFLAAAVGLRLICQAAG